MTADKPIPFHYGSVTVADSAVGLSASHDAYRVEGSLETAQIRVRVDSTDPTSSEGHLMEVGDLIVLDTPEAIVQFAAIRTGATSGVLKTTYFR